MSKEYTIKEDAKFGYKRVIPTPTEKEISDYYANEFYTSQYGGLNDSSVEVQIKDKDWYDSRWEDIINTLESHMGELRGKSVLDVGCGWGQALLYFKEKGLECFGFDPAQDAIDYAKNQGLEVKCTGMQKVDVFERKFDVVTMINVLEHLSDPEQVILEIREKILNNNGVLVIDVPNEFNVFQMIASKEFKLDEWWVAPPAHLNYFNPESLRSLLEGCGFAVELVEASFPLEMFMLFGDVYVGNGELGRKCHEKRMMFESLMRKHGQTEKLRALYKSFADLGLGRQIVAYATIKR